jgi:uncharacterized circularly permuted ATP-grasp superfamily protein
VVATVHPIRTSRRLAEYEPPQGCYDEAFEAPGRPRQAYVGVLSWLEEGPPQRIAEALRAGIARRGMRFRTPAGERPFPVDPLPRLLTAAEHAELAAGIAQRTQALNAFVADVYGRRRIFESGLVPVRLITDSQLYEPLMQGIEVPGGTFIHVAGPDLVRDPQGRFFVLEDNLRSPSGLAFALETRRTLATELPLAHFEPLPISGAVEALGLALRAAAPASAAEPEVVLLSDGEGCPARYEHRSLAEQLQVPLVSPGELEVSAGRVWRRAERTRAAVDVIYRRTTEERLSRAGGGLTDLGELLAEPVRRGTVAVANAFGTGVADDKLAHAYVERMIRFYLGQEPLLPSLPTHDLGDPAELERALENLDRMVVKRREGAGGGDVHIPVPGDRAGRDHVAAMIREAPHDHVTQERMRLSTHPTLRGDRLEPRRVDLRPFVIASARGYAATRAALTRYAPSPDSMHVNSSQGGGGKDTWVIA